MNLLQSFMGCMYPGSIRTESMDSMEHCDPEFYFQVLNVDESDNPVSHGELQITDGDLIYFKPSKFPTRWPLDCIRRYGCTGQKFVFEVGRKCSTGQAIYAFRLNNAEELVDKLKIKIGQLSSNNKIPRSSYCAQLDLDRSRKRDASTSTDNQIRRDSNDRGTSDPKPLSYALIDFDTTKALTATAQAHAASRDVK